MARSVWDDWGVLPSAFHSMETIPAKEEAMKVQRKCDPFKTWEVIEESPNHYIVSDGSPRGEGLAYCLPKADYEPVQEWVIVPIEKVDRDTRGYIGQNGNCNSYFFVDKYGNYITSDHEPIIIDGKVGLRRRKV